MSSPPINIPSPSPMVTQKKKSTSNSNFKKDVAIILNVIDHHENKLGIQSMFEKGPPKDKQFICNNDDGYWTQKEFDSLFEIGEIVLSYNYKNDGYYVMMNTIHKEFKRRSLDLQRRSLDTISNSPSLLEKELFDKNWINFNLKDMKISNDV